MENNISFKFSFVLIADYEHDFDDLEGISVDYEIVKHKKGQMKSNNTIRDSSTWSLNSDSFFSFTLEDAFNVYFQRSRISEFKALSNYLKEQKMLHCKVQIIRGDVMPGISLNSDIIRFLYEMNCELSVDLYDMRE